MKNKQRRWGEGMRKKRDTKASWKRKRRDETMKDKDENMKEENGR